MMAEVFTQNELDDTQNGECPSTICVDFKNLLKMLAMYLNVSALKEHPSKNRSNFNRNSSAGARFIKSDHFGQALRHNN
ncbi:unnamed protein product [Allacma fusca]|uniref:Uncharacterized protein n=1 Tax=Allacma fusca TaxID=39272 RepID=A0A8J2PXD1_9HEXA|nr:unnamed protein product [Allacma fusca]